MSPINTNEFLIYLLVIVIIILSMILLKNKVHSKFKKIVVIQYLLFFGLFSGLLYYEWLNFRNNNTNLSETKEDKVVVNGEVLLKDSIIINAPIISQYPELPRGCEVTSLAMLLQFVEVNTNKFALARLVKKNDEPLYREHGVVHWGDPNEGFNGDMYSTENPGYGVYNKPIRELAESFLGDRVVDFTGSEFTEVMKYLSQGMPVWIVTNKTYKKLPDSSFETWETPNGPVQTTIELHSVLVTGYDNDFIYFNDPLSGVQNMKANKVDFIEAWEQMGKQAISIN